MRGRLAVLAVLLAGAALAEAPVESLLPEMRPEAEPLGRPEPRPDGLGGAAGALVLEVRPEGQPVALLAAPEIGPSPATAPSPEPAREVVPDVPREPPLIAAEAEFEGPPQLVGTAPPTADASLRVVLDGWAGDAPPVRPAPEAPAEDPLPGRPRPRPELPGDAAIPLPADPEDPPAYVPGAPPAILPVGPDVSLLAVAVALLPSARPDGIVARAEEVRVSAVRGQVCGNPLIQGEVSGPVGGGGCGIEEPVSVRSVDGVRLSEAALMDCTTAEALLDWVREAARPAVGSRGGGLAGLQVMGHYACRPRNNQAGARLSEHGRGRAIDIGAIQLADGSSLSVARDWPDAALRQMHEAACGIFSTTLGPGSDGYHEDHLHYDTARGRGPYCR